MAFSLNRASRPARPAAPSECERKQKTPKCSELDIQAGPRPTTPERLPQKAEVEVSIYKVTDEAWALWDDVQGDGISLYQVQIRHDAQNSVTVNLYDKFDSFLKAQDSAPQSLVELQKQALIKLVTTDSRDADGVGTFQRWRNAFYVAGASPKALINFMHLLDDFWFEAGAEVGEELTVALHPHVNIDIAEASDFFVYEFYRLHSPAASLPMGIFEAHPVQGNRILMMILQIESDDELSFVVHGATWAFRNLFDAFGMPGYRSEADDGQSKYFRVLKSVNSKSADDRDKVLRMLGDGVLRNTAIRVDVDAQLKPGTNVFAFVQTLRKRPHLHFA